MGRDRHFQAILPLRGKILNVEKTRLDRVLANEEIKAMMDNFRANPPKEIGGSAVSLIKDYKTLELTDAQGNVSKLDMPETSNVLQYFTVDGTKISVRPSGTEPKIKFYIEVKGEMGCPKCYTSADAEAEKKVEAVRKSLGI